MMKLRDLDIAWAAGFLMADGSIGINKSGVPTKQGQTWALKVRAANADLAPLQLLKQLFGGSIWTLTHRVLQTTQHYEWCVQGTTAKETLREVYPFLAGRHRWLAALVFLFPYHPRGVKGICTRYTKEERRYRGEVIAWIRQAVRTHL